MNGVSNKRGERSTTVDVSDGIRQPGVAVNPVPKLLYVPTQPELRIAFPDSLAPHRTSPEYVPTQPPQRDSDSHDRPTPIFGLAESAEQVAPRKVALLRLDGASAGELHELTEAGIVVGRAPECGLVLEDSGISRRHAVIEYSKRKWRLRDLGSRNGSFLNDRRVDSALMDHGALVRFGPVVCFAFQHIDARQEATLKRLFESSDRDAITGAHNRRYAEDRLTTEVSAALRHQRALAVVLLDVDKFRAINRKHGHISGDVVLRHVAESLRPALRAEDVFSRYGGDEFLLILRETGAFEAGATAERLRRALCQSPVLTRSGPITVSVSAGCAELSECAAPTATDLFALATERLNKAKEAGRNKVVIA